MPPVLQISNLSTHIQLTKSVVQAVGNADLSIEPGETLGLVGESGCGKSMTGLSIMGLLPQGGAIVGGSIKLDGRELVGLSDAELRTIRGNDIAMIFQDPLTSLDPTKKIGYQVAEPVRLHKGASKAAAKDRAIEVLGLVGLPRPAERLADYPHQLSGGLRQRVMIAMALSCEPKLLIADEPTTALDVTIQAQILALLHDLKDRLGMAMLLITHDMGVIAGHADRVQVMYAGRMVETAETGNLFRHMRHPYTRALLASIPRLTSSRRQQLLSIGGLPPDLATHRPAAGSRRGAAGPPTSAAARSHRWPARPRSTCSPAGIRSMARPVARPRPAAGRGRAGRAGRRWGRRPGRPCSRCATWSRSSRSPPARSCNARWAACTRCPTSRSPCPPGDVRPGRRVGLRQDHDRAGGGGAGAPRLGRRAAGGQNISALSGGELRRQRRDLQLMFQDPYSSLDPRMRVGSIIREPLSIQQVGTRQEQEQRVFELLDEVGLPRSAVERYPHEFSGGQRQRIGLARALTLNPKVIVADEPVSALDVSIRAQVLNLMKRLQADHGLTYIVISHDLAVVKYMADRIGVMYLGKMVEMAPADAIYQRAAHPYTAGLIATIPGQIGGGEAAKNGAGIKGELPSPINPPSGCRFRTRCPYVQDLCAEEEPPLRSFGPGHIAACHFPLQAQA